MIPLRLATFEQADSPTIAAIANAPTATDPIRIRGAPTVSPFIDMSSFLVIKKAVGVIFAPTADAAQFQARRIAVAERRQYSEPQKHKSR